MLSQNHSIPSTPAGPFSPEQKEYLAGFMAGVAANVSAFNTVVTYDLWEPYVKSDMSDTYYIRFGRIATVGGPDGRDSFALVDRRPYDSISAATYSWIIRALADDARDLLERGALE